MKKSIAAVALAGLITLTGSAPAMATTYPAPGTTATVSDGTVAPGEPFVFSGTGFVPGETITITVTLVAGPQAIGGSLSGGASAAVPAKIYLPAATQSFTTVADSAGAFSYTLTINEPGTYSLLATGASGRTAGPVTVKVVGAPLAGTGTTPGTGLADTGADPSLLLWGAAGVAALGLGAASVITVRRRAKATETNS